MWLSHVSLYQINYNRLIVMTRTTATIEYFLQLASILNSSISIVCLGTMLVSHISGITNRFYIKVNQWIVADLLKPKLTIPNKEEKKARTQEILNGNWSTQREWSKNRMNDLNRPDKPITQCRVLSIFDKWPEFIHQHRLILLLCWSAIFQGNKFVFLSKWIDETTIPICWSQSAQIDTFVESAQ